MPSLGFLLRTVSLKVKTLMARIHLVWRKNETARKTWAEKRDPGKMAKDSET
jgi:hypothetical protein